MLINFQDNQTQLIRKLNEFTKAYRYLKATEESLVHSLIQEHSNHQEHLNCQLLKTLEKYPSNSMKTIFQENDSQDQSDDSSLSTSDSSSNTPNNSAVKPTKSTMQSSKEDHFSLITPTHPRFCNWKINLWKEDQCYRCQKQTPAFCVTCSKFFEIKLSLCSVCFLNHYRELTQDPYSLTKFISYVNSERAKRNLPPFEFFQLQETQRTTSMENENSEDSDLEEETDENNTEIEPEDHERKRKFKISTQGAFSVPFKKRKIIQ